MEQLKKITKAWTSRELELLVANDTGSCWNVVSRVNYISQATLSDTIGIRH